MDYYQTAADCDPTGVLASAAAAVALVGSVVRAVPAFKNVGGVKKDVSGGGGSSTLNRSQTAIPEPWSRADPERERRAYETVNYVLREFGCRICEAGLVDGSALTKALSGATKHIEVRLFSVEANRLFESLASKLGDPILVNSVFTSIYLIGALTAELCSSLPNYKESYVPVGPRLVQQLFRTAIGEGAFRDNLTANLDAYNTLATTAGLLRPTDIGYSTFPGFPSFSPCRYSNRSFGDVRNHRLLYEKLVRHFDKSGFPQPTSVRRQEVGTIKDWRFLAGDSNSRAFEIEKADKHIGENFGRVLYWLICSADRMPPGVAIVAYHDQHIELVNWIGERMGFCVFNAATDLEMTGPHAKLDKKARAIVDTWVIIMSSEKAQTNRRAASTLWTKSHMSGTQLPPVNPAHQTPSRSSPVPTTPQAKSAASPAVTPVTVSQASPRSAVVVNLPEIPSTQARPKTVAEQLEELDMIFNDALLPQCQRFLFRTPMDAKDRDFEYKRLTQAIDRSIILRLDELQIQRDDTISQQQRKELVVKAQTLVGELDSKVSAAPASPFQASAVEASPIIFNNLTRSSTQPGPVPVNPGEAQPTTFDQPTTTLPYTPPVSLHSAKAPNATFDQTSSGFLQPSPAATVSPPPYSPTTPPSAGVTMPLAYPFPNQRPASVIRRKAPPPPKKFIIAKALYGFEPEEGNDEELAFNEGDEIEIIEKTAALVEEGWCRARIKGGKKIGMVPLEYLEEVKNTSPTHRLPANLTQPAMGTQNTHVSPTCPISEFTQGDIASYSAGVPQIAYSSLDGESTRDMGPSPVLQSSDLYGAQSSHFRNGYLQNGPQRHAEKPKSVQSKSRVGLEAAGIAIAATGAAAAVAITINGSGQQDATNVTNDPGNVPAQPDNVPAQPDNDPSTDSSTFDPSASEPSGFYEPTLIPQEPNPVAPLAAIDPFYASQNPDLANAPDFASAMAATGVPQEPYAETGMEMGMATASPLAALSPTSVALPAPTDQYACEMTSPLAGLGAPPEWPELIGDPSPPMTAMTQQSTESMVTNAEDTLAGAEGAGDYAAYEMDL